MRQGTKPETAAVVDDRDDARRPSNAGSTPSGSEQRPVDILAQHVAISEILRVMSGSPGDVQPVLDAVAERAAHLCEAPFATVWLVDGDVLNTGAAYSLDGTRRTPAPLPLMRSTVSGRAILDRATIHYEDLTPLLETEYPDAINARAQGMRAVLGVPLMREGKAYGSIFLFRREPRAFSPDQVALVETFAQQAAIAIDNARLFKETKEALAQQTATSEVLRVMASSPTDVQPMLNAVVERAAQLCEAANATIFLVDGDNYLAAARFGDAKRERALELGQPLPLGRGSVAGRAIIDRTTLHLADVALAPEEEYPIARQWQRIIGHHTLLAVPLMREDRAIGAFVIFRMEVRPFSEKQIALVKTFADQAAIAIENVRLFNETNEALERQTATSEILRVISRSPTNVQPVFDTIAAAALRLCGAAQANVFTFDGQLIHLAALAHADRRSVDALSGVFPRPPSRDTAVSRAVLTGSVVMLPDVLEDPEYRIGAAALASGFRSVLAIPLIREGKPIGAIALGRLEPSPFGDKQISLLHTFADQAVIAIENVRLFNETKEALERQTATSEILNVISQSPTDVQPVFDAIVQSAKRVFGALTVAATRVVGDSLHLAAFSSTDPGGDEALERFYPMPISGSMVGEAVMGGAIFSTGDVLSDPRVPARAREIALVRGYRSMIIAPMICDGVTIGTINISRTEPGQFSDHQHALLKTFAKQAVIAVENVRLFNETTEALERQTAMSEILRVISGSPTDAHPVFDTIVASAARLCGAESAAVYRFDDEMAEFVAGYHFSPEALEAYRRRFPCPLRETDHLQRVLDRSVLNISDIEKDAHTTSSGDVYRARDMHSTLLVPMVREDRVIGAIGVSRRDVGAFSADQVELLKTFADQAVIAIENVRLFTELTHKNRALTQAHAQVSEALQRQTATSDILSVISQSPTDVQPVFETIATAAMKLCGGNRAHVFTSDGKQLHVGSLVSTNPGPEEEIRKYFPRPLGKDLAASRAILTGSVVVIPDVLDDAEYALKELAPAGGFRSVLAVPLLREGNSIGAIAVSRPEAGPFPDNQIALLQTFAAQAVIAIENVRLFNETKEALERQIATSEILRVISQSPRDVQPVFDSIAASAMRLCHGSSVTVTTYDGQLLHLVALATATPEGADALRKVYPLPPGRNTAGTRAVLTCSIAAIPDVLEDHDFDSATRAAALAGGFRSVVGVPLIREGKPIGVIVVGRPEAGPFPDKQIALLKTFADQAVIAIENVRLFTELEARTHELTRSVQELKALGEVGQAVSSTLDLETVLSTIVSRAAQLAGMDGGSIWEYDEARKEFYLHATDRLPDELVEALRAAPIRKGEGALGRLAMTGEPVQIRDIVKEPEYPSRLREMLIRAGHRSVLAVPLLREDHLLGALAVNRSSSGDFAPEVIELLKTFATQSALAIQNARLFREVEVKSRELETASRHKSEFLANMSHELRTPLNAIIGFSEVLSERMFGELNEKQAEYIGDILQSGQHLLSLINDILDLSKVEAGRMELELSEFDLPSMIENALTLVRERAVRKGITLGRMVNARLGMIRADERKVKQVLLNLLSNALKFTPEGGRIDVQGAVNDRVAEISVTDTGVGIAPEEQEAVFEEFRQVGTASKKVEGTGLGLAISRKFIELHGGKIWVTSQPGIGSTFAFTLPLR